MRRRVALSAIGSTLAALTAGCHTILGDMPDRPPDPARDDLTDWRHEEDASYDDLETAIDGPSVDVTDEGSLGYSNPVWMDADGRLYGRRGNVLLQSDDGWESVDWLHEFDTDERVYGILTTDDDRVVAGVGDDVYVSDDDRSEWDRVHRFERGRFVFQYGHAVSGEHVVIGSWATGTADEDERPEVIYSDDGGASWERIFEPPIVSESSGLRIHDVEYDPYDDRLWVAVGTGMNTDLYYSDDGGETWTAVWDIRGERLEGIPTPPMISQIVAYPDRVIFGSNGVPEGIYLWERESAGPTSPEDLTFPHVVIDDLEDETSREHLARRSWTLREETDGRDLCLMPFGAHSETAPSVVLASPDGGESWHEVYRHDEPEEPSFTNCIGPHPDDPDETVLFTDSSGEGYFVEAELPSFE